MGEKGERQWGTRGRPGTIGEKVEARDGGEEGGAMEVLGVAGPLGKKGEARGKVEVGATRGGWSLGDAGVGGERGRHRGWGRGGMGGGAEGGGLGGGTGARPPQGQWGTRGAWRLAPWELG